MIGSGMRILLIDLILLTSVCLTWGGFASLLPLPQNFSVNSFYINWLHMGQDCVQMQSLSTKEVDSETLNRLAENERHFHTIQSGVRGLASTWTLAAFASIAILLK